MSRRSKFAGQELRGQGRHRSVQPLPGQGRALPTPPTLEDLARKTQPTGAGPPRNTGPVNSAGPPEALGLPRGSRRWLRSPAPPAPCPEQGAPDSPTPAAHAVCVSEQGGRAEWGPRTRALCRRAHMAGSHGRSRLRTCGGRRPPRRERKGAKGQHRVAGSGLGAAHSPATIRGTGHSPLWPAAQSSRGGRRFSGGGSGPAPRLLLLPPRPARLPTGPALPGKWLPARPLLLILLGHLPRGGNRGTAGSSLPAGLRSL